jgi:hypothetical protein
MLKYFSGDSIEAIAHIDLELDSNNSTQASEQITTGQYIYRSIATNLETLSDSKVIHFYNQRGEDSENRIKELKNEKGVPKSKNRTTQPKKYQSKS